MKRSTLLALPFLFSIALCARAHLCNDVFDQASDNLAVKVDIRDGQLRIGSEASFRVYLLNTMDRNIANINLEITSTEFSAVVKPGSGWDSFPSLATSKKGGTKVYFDVTLARKPGIADGKYKIGLRLFNGEKPDMEFKTVDLETAAGAHSLPPGKDILIDGNVVEPVWKDAELCTDFYVYEKNGQYFTNKRAAEQVRIRVAGDKKDLCFAVSFQGKADSDQVTILAAASTDANPVSILVNRTSGAVTFNGNTNGIEAVSSADGNTIECRLNRMAIGLPDASFLLNFTRTLKNGEQERILYWRGNSYSVNSPIVYDRFALAE